MKCIAFVLPQFHQIAENDSWWGEGFTEWTNVRKATALYPEHDQPKKPLNNNYYDLTDPNVKQWQAETAKAHGIYGFCYYHYWFNGRRLLEQPVQQILASKEPDFPFCLSWANEPWTRSWDGTEEDVLMPQEYGEERDWRMHFYALLEAFKDKRYICVDGKPVFIIYRSSSIPRCDEMLQCWRDLAQQNGLKGLHLVRTLGGFPLKTEHGFDASLEFEPHYTFAHGGVKHLWSSKQVEDQKHIVIDYDELWESMLERTPHRDGEIIYPGAFVNWDNTPRKGAAGQSTLGANPHKFGQYLSRQIERTKKMFKSDFIYINAWNEWAEGAYLEPDDHYRYQYLQAIKKALQYHHKEDPSTP